jgi:hypothetical protein
MLCMKSLTFLAALIFSVAGFAQSATTSVDQSHALGHREQVMVVAVAHDASVIGGGISSSNFLPPGIATVEPIAWITAEGNWIQLDCTDGKPEACKRLDRTYLSQPHDYSVISGDGFGTTVHVQRMKLDQDCFGIGGRGKFDVGAIHSAAVAAETADLFSAGAAAHRVPESDAVPMRKALAQAVGSKLDTTKDLRVYSVNLDGHDLLIFQRAFQDWASKPEYAPPHSPEFEEVFALGYMDGSKLRILHWKEDTADDNEQILGVIHTRAGHDFLVGASSDPEGNEYRVYGYRDGKLLIVLHGGGGEC